MLQAVDNAGHTPRESNFRIRDAQAERIACADFHGDMRILAHLHQFVDKRYDESVIICPRDIFQMASGNYAVLEGQCHRGEVFVHRLLAGQAEFIENMVITAGYQNTRLMDVQIPYKLKVFFRGADPCCDLRKIQPEVHALCNCIPVLFAVDKKLRLPDNAVRPAEPAHQLVQVNNLFHCIWLDRLLSVTESGVGNPDFFRHTERHTPVVERHPWHFIVTEEVGIEISMFYVLERVTVGLLLQQVGFVG